MFDPDTGKLLGAGLVGPGAGELLAEAVCLIEMGADAEDIGRPAPPPDTFRNDRHGRRDIRRHDHRPLNPEHSLAGQERMSNDVRGDPVIRTIAMPADTNPAGDIFGGWLMAQMDLAAGNLAARIAKGRSATVAVEAMSFLGGEGRRRGFALCKARLDRTQFDADYVEAWRRDRCSEFLREGDRCHLHLCGPGQGWPVKGA